ncbi:MULTISPECIES: M48 family metallopeptidase [Leptolyngbya]|jgi:Zn-dependent protease with chaperone function|uniref:Peptidase, M48 family protein n=1 Tax=Leptolyngbya boryana NIES-2135 TaxID=1973484 RepID=A0A1Z4JCH0_LEPBY|nr:MULTISPECIES: M48 family metallopeptidase [Leptolyngbya]BAY54442.1 peptidase, M48 family protein [Leptolyngbya boryana NIES-2135]MBD2370050.1 M48 family metallopeptidase [Leptolyngbya sp. FACHB-161]MBD2376483.1 M48 family metallopeptidase [Leptolyngbya sp. FACHB-238]MBD2400757.1 M48 family metallopeptidase [Leptolyngbya sp. FACHB-239]MBD2407300.1 M48 family metallopeptidase [Leptolyngbya sp. FACHB-402]
MPNYPGISSEAFRHPLDRQAEDALRRVPGFDLVARKFVEFIYERPRYIYLMGNSIQVGARQFSSVYQIFRECLQSLDISPEPALFVSQSPVVNAYALGQERPCVVLNSELLDLLSETELRSVIAHELGHLKCGHTTLMQMATWAYFAIAGLSELTFGLSSLISTGLLMAFYEWLRKAELSADRASLLVMDDLNLTLTGMMRLAGGSKKYAHEMNLDELIKQSDRYQALDEDQLNQFYKFSLYNDLSSGVFQSHPFTIERIRFLQEWATSSEFQNIRQGNYVRVGAEGSVETEPRTEEADRLKREIEELQREIDRLKRPD